MDLKKKRIKIVNSEVKHTGVTRHVKGPKTKSSKRLVIVPSRVLNILKDWKAACDQKRPTWNNHKSIESKLPDDHVIVNLQDGSLPYPDTFTGWAANYIRKHGFNRVTPQGLRHFYLTYLILNGQDVKTVQTLAGHSNPRITLAIYTAVTQEGYEKAEAILDAI